MLTPVVTGTAIVACNTCRRPAVTRDGAGGARGGAGLVAALRRVRAQDPACRDIAVHEMPCLFACADGCVVHLSAPGKIAYVLGRFAADAAAARAILDYAIAYAASDEGEVAYPDWPDGVKGHFIARTPPVGFVAAR